MPLKKIKRAVNKVANRLADALVPKEIAPILPIAASFAPGFLLPQLLTAAGSAKMRGEIDPKQQAIQGILSALKTPQTQTAAESALLEDPELLKQLRMADVEAGKTIITDPIELQKLADANQIEGLNIFQGGDVFGPGIGDPGFKPFGGVFDDILGGPFQPGDAMGPQEIFSFDTPEGMRFFRPESAELSEFLQTAGEAPDLSTLTGDALRKRVVADTTLTDKSFARRLGDLQDTLGKEPMLDALNKARGFIDTPVGFNKPTFTKVGIGSLPFLSAYAANLRDEDAAALAEEEAQAEALDDARDDLFNYFRRLSDPRGIFAALGGRVGAQEGGPISGITDMINENIDQMQDNLSQQIQGGFTTQETIVPVDEAQANTMTQPQPQGFNQGVQMMPNVDLFRQRLQRPMQSLGQQSLFSPMSRQMMARQRQGLTGLSSLMRFAEGGMTSAPGMPKGMQVDGRNGTFIPMGVREKADDVPAMLSKNEFVMTADAVRAMGNGDVNKGAQRMYDLMNSLEARV